MTIASGRGALDGGALGDAPPGPLVIRVDASRNLGTGHLLRCIALAEEWKSRGGRVHVLAHLGGAAPSRLAESDISWESWEHSAEDPDDVAATVQRAINFTGGEPGGWVLLDGYRFDAEYYEAARATGLRVMVIEDGPRLPWYPVDMIVDGNPNAPDRYPAPDDTVLLRGARFVLLRREFARRAAAGAGAEAHSGPPRVLVTFGGSDPRGLTLRTLSSLRGADTPVEWAVVVGSHFREPEPIRSLAAELGPAVTVVDQPADLSTWMDWADVVLGSAGSTAWEIAACRVPAALVVAADNQAAVAATLGSAGAAVDLGWHEHLSGERLVGAAIELAMDPDRRRRMATAAGSMIDGAGAARIVEVASSLTAGKLSPDRVRVRPADEGDARPAWLLANDPEVRARSFARPEIPWESHQSWFQRALGAADVGFWILEVGGVLAGVVRYQRSEDGSEAEVHFAVAAPFRGRGLATGALKWTFEPACAQLGVARVRGLVLKSNAASARAFTSAGYEQVAERVERGQECFIFERRCSRGRVHT